MTAGIPPRRTNPNPAKRGNTQGWTEKVARANTKFLYSIEPDSLTGHGWTFTLTLRDCPETAEEFGKLRKRLFDRLKKRGLIRLHWVTEWTKRGVPHLHGCAWFDDDHSYEGLHIDDYWIDIVTKAGYVAGSKGQHVVPISDEVGWFKYLSKHASRGVKHYQRCNVPEQWKHKTGRMWGYSGKWERLEIKFEINLKHFHKLRRLVKKYIQSQHRHSKTDIKENPKERKQVARNVIYSRTMLRCNDRTLSGVRGLSEWAPEEVTLRMLEYLKSIGAKISN